MSQRTALRRRLAATSVLALLGLGVVPAHAATQVRLLSGATRETTVFPNNTFTVADAQQLTGRRIHLPVPHCTNADYSICDGAALVNQLDGFDVQPRVTIPFSGPIDVGSVDPSAVYIDGPDGHSALWQLVWDPATNTLAGTSAALLRERTTYQIVVTNRVRDRSGRRVDVCGSGCTARRTAFTTMSASDQLDRIRRALDDGSAYAQAHITAAQRGATFTQGSQSTVFLGPNVVEIQRVDDIHPKGALPAPVLVPDLALANAGTVAFGSFLSPQFANDDAVIPRVPSGRTSKALKAGRTGFAMIMPNGVPPAGGWPTLIYGVGFTRSHYDLFVTADINASAGFATIAIDPVGHLYGPRSRTVVTTAAPPGSVSFLSYGRGHDSDGDGTIGNSEGVQPADHKTMSGGKVVADVPSHNALVGLRDGLIQTVADQMALVRLIERGVDVDGNGTPDLRRTDVMYYGLSFGGIYGTMLMGTDTHLKVGLLNVPGGPIVDIARLSGFRDLLAAQLKVSRPNLLNGGPGLFGFTEDIPLPDEAPLTKPHPGAITLQGYLADANWLERPGSPETMAPLIRLRPRYPITKKVLFQTAFGDNTVPNVTAGNIYRAGQLFDRVTYYRNDKTPTSDTNPHGFLADPTLAGREFGQAQFNVFFKTAGATTVDPDGPGPMFEVPIANAFNLTCLHYPDPQTGHTAFPPAAAGDCATLPPSVGGPGLPGFPGTTGGSGSGSSNAGGDDLAATGGLGLPAVLLAAGGTLAVAGAYARRRRLTRR